MLSFVFISQECKLFITPPRPSLATTPKITQNHLQFEHFTLLLVVKSDIAEEADKVYLIKLEHLHNKVFLYMILGRYFIIFIHSVSS